MLKAKLILDVGCGETKKGDIGLDARRLPGVDVVGDIHYLPFRDNIFDKVVSYAVLEHSLNPFNCLKEQVRVLKSRGTIYCETDNARYWRFHISLQDHVRHFRSARYSPSDTHYMIFYPENIEKMFKLLGLENVKSNYLLPDGKSKKFDRLVRLFFPENSYPRFYVQGWKPGVENDEAR